MTSVQLLLCWNLFMLGTLPLFLHAAPQYGVQHHRDMYARMLNIKQGEHAVVGGVSNTFRKDPALGNSGREKPAVGSSGREEPAVGNSGREEPAVNSTESADALRTLRSGLNTGWRIFEFVFYGKPLIYRGTEHCGRGNVSSVHEQSGSFPQVTACNTLV